MNIKLLINANTPKNLAHFQLHYGYSSYSHELQNHTLENSFTTRQMASLDSMLSTVRPLSENDAKVIAQVAEKASFLETVLDTEFTKGFKIQLNVDSFLNRKFMNLAKKILPREHPWVRRFSPEISYIYPDTKQVVIGTREFDMSKVSPESSMVISTYLHVKDSGVEAAVAFTLLHETIHTLEAYNNQTYGCSQDKAHDVLKMLTQIDKGLDSEGKRVELSAHDQKIITELSTLYGEIYADCGAVLLQRNYDLLHHHYDQEQFSNYMQGIVKMRKGESTVYNHLQPDAMTIAHHYTVPGLEFLMKELESYPSEKLSQQAIHHLSQRAVSMGIVKTLQELDPQHQSHLDSIFQLFSRNFDTTVLDYLSADNLNNTPKAKFAC